MKTKRKSPKAIRQEKLYGIITLGTPFVAAGTLQFGSVLANDKDATFTSPYDGGFRAGDYIWIDGQQNDRSQRVKYKKVHVARRRQAKNKLKPVVFEIENTTATTITIKGDGLYEVSTITSA